MKIALLTIWHEKNYGAELQAYATIRALQQLGHEVELIDIRLSDCHRPNLNGRIGNWVSYFGPANRKFNCFWSKFFPTTRRYHSVNELKENPPQADVYMVGSDQVWNPDLTGDFAKMFFLDFGSDTVRRVSYASSFGTDTWNATYLTKDVKRLLDRFNSLSCREESGIGLLKDVFGVQATMTVDPTLLFDHYQELTGELAPKNTLVYYPLTSDLELTSFAKYVASNLGLDLVNNMQSSFVFGKITWDRVGIEDWVRNIAEAQFVITRSFHGLVFSILYRKPFAIIVNRNNRATRILNLLEQLGLEERYYNSIDICYESHPWSVPIDYDAVHARLKSLRQSSFKYLMSALQ